MKLSEPSPTLDERFQFGANWKDFVPSVGPAQIEAAQASLRTMLGLQDLKGISVLDVGSGSGLFSLAARRLGARVHSFDFDRESVAATSELRERYATGDPEWTVEQGDILDAPYVARLGEFDIVYSWGVLHHTGDMWTALRNVAQLVSPDGRLFVSIYNDQGLRSRIWLKIKRRYNRSSRLGRKVMVVLARTYFSVLRIASGIVGHCGRRHRRHQRSAEPRPRGMSRQHDLVDWIGGYPFEVAAPEEIFHFFADRGFTLTRLKTCRGGLGCNEFVFTRP